MLSHQWPIWRVFMHSQRLETDRISLLCITQLEQSVEDCCWRLAAGGTRVDGVSAGGRADVQRSSAAGSASWGSEQLACQRGVPLAPERPKGQTPVDVVMRRSETAEFSHLCPWTIINTAWLVSHRRDSVSLACAYKRKEWVYREGWEEINVDTERQIKCDGEFVLKWKIPCLLLINVSGFIVRDSSAQVNIDVCFNNFLCVSVSTFCGSHQNCVCGEYSTIIY